MKTKEAKKTRMKTNQKSELPARRRTANQSKRLCLRFSPTAWAKLLYFRDKSDNEVGGFGITGHDLLFVEDFVTVKQQVTCVSVKFDDEAVANFFEDQVDLGRRPEQFARIWCHTHPGMSPEPSMIDEDTFVRVFGNCQWSVMLIVAEDNNTYAKLSFNVGPGGQVLIPVEIDYGCEFGPSNRRTWDAEYEANVVAEPVVNIAASQDSFAQDEFGDMALPYDILDEFEEMDLAERQDVLDELAVRSES